MIQFTVEIEIVRPAGTYSPISPTRPSSPPGRQILSRWWQGKMGHSVSGRHRARCTAPPAASSWRPSSRFLNTSPIGVFALRMLEGALPIDARITFEPMELGTQVLLAAHGRPSGAMRLAQPLLRLSLKRRFAGYCATLKRVFEDADHSTNRLSQA